MNISYTYTVSSTIVAAVTATTVSATTVSYDVEAVATQTSDLEATVYIVPLTPLAEQQVFASENALYDVGLNKDDSLTLSDDYVNEVDKVLTDTVTVTESTVKIYTDLVDYDPSDDDVDPDPITMADSDAKTLERPDVVDSVAPGDTTELSPEKVLSDVTNTPTDAIDKFDVELAKADTATPVDSIDQFDVTTELSDTVTITETTAKDFTHGGFADDVTMLGSNIKAMNSSVDFDPSDDDVDPDPITASDAINSFAAGKTLTDSATAVESDAKDFTFGGFNDTATGTDSAEYNVTRPVSDSVTAVEGAKFHAQPAKSDSVTASDTISKFDPRIAKDDSFSLSDAVDKFDITKGLTDTINITDVAVKNFTENVDFDRSDADADADPVTATDVYGINFTRPRTDSVSPSDAPTFSVGGVYADSVQAQESIYTLLTLGESTYLYPDLVNVSDGGDAGVVQGYHISAGQAVSRVEDYRAIQDWTLLNEAVIFPETADGVQRYRGFQQDRFRFRTTDFFAQLNGDPINEERLWGTAVDTIATHPYTGVIGAAGYIGQVVVNSDTITYPDETIAGLVVDYIYADTDDKTLGGYYLNQIPIL